jgi:TolB-like protein/Tfp pilus assembly protein PilF/tRNA A-37 threonylcarbamoyl transferase component Bud32
LLPPDWEKLAPLIDAILEAPPEQRSALVIELSGGDSHRHAELARMVAECEQSTPFLTRPAAERFASLFDDEAEVAMPEVLGGRYHIEREIGRGGMARVYLAKDPKHARRVAVKVIRPELAMSLGRERFLREIAIAARLRHPNIVPLYDSGDADGVLYFVMPYEEGPSLRVRLSGGVPLMVGERVSVLRDVARALAYAHEQGVVHRDVKPDNVIVSGGAAVVTDFGISKAVSVAQGVASAPTLTNAGAGIGTPAYMAPEQALGDPSTDHRADIYAFGCLAYELFTGQPPFHDMPTHQLIAAHVSTKPVPVLQASRDVPREMATLIERCLEKNPDARPQSAQELVASLEGTLPLAARPARRRRLSNAAMLALGAVAVMVVGAGGYLGTRPRGASAPHAGAHTVAVLPLLSSGGDSLQQELADGLSDEIAASLFRVAGLRIVSRRGAGNYRGHRAVDPIEVGKQLGARYLVMGSLREANGRLVVVPQLLDATDGTLLWSDRFDRVQGDLGAIRDDIARAVSDTLRHTLGLRGGELSAGEQSGRSTNPEAYRLYVLAQRALTRRGKSLRSSIDMFRRATELDTLYAKAYAGLSIAEALSPYFQLTPIPEASVNATRAAERALRLDPTLAQPHIALGIVHYYSKEWRSADEELRTAVELDGHDVEARVQYGRYLTDPDSALAQFRAAQNEDPASALVLSYIALMYFAKGQLDSALVESTRAFQTDSNNFTTLVFNALIRFKAGRLQEARQFAERAPTTPQVLYVLASLGDTASAFARFRQLERGHPSHAFLQAARAGLMMGAHDTAQALSALEQVGEQNLYWVGSKDPMYESIRESPRFQRILKKIGRE